MPADRQEVNAQLLGVYHVFSISLDSVHMEQGAWISLLNDLAGLCNWLYRADFIVDIHDRYQNSLWRKRFLQLFQRNPAIPVYLQVSNRKSLFFQELHRVRHGGMFHPGGNQMHAAAPVGQGGADNGQVIGFRPPGSKDNL